MINFAGKRVLVYGMGMSGQAACRLLHEKGACVSFYDDDDRFGSFFACEKNPLSKSFDYLVVSPGVKVNGNEIISHFLLAKIPILSELDLGYLFTKGKIVGITGTNGKTTTTLLLGEILKAAGRRVHVCGNVGLPLTSVAEQTTAESVVVCEVSNFQLELSQKFKADYATILNLAPDHIDRHGTFEEYVRVKSKILSSGRQKVFLNFDDERVRSLSQSKKVQYFSLFPLNKGVFIKNNAIFHNKTKIMPISEVPLIGDKNLSNVMAATIIAISLKVKPKVIRSAVAGFKPPHHRLELVGKLSSGAIIVDDSKATNISSVEMALESLRGQKITLLLGGLNKDCNFEPFFANKPKIFDLVCFGQAGEYISGCARKFGYEPKTFSTMREGCLYAKGAKEGVVLLSPGCASFDEFASYAVRGEIFKEIMLEES